MQNKVFRIRQLFFTICMLTVSFMAMAQRNVTGRVTTDDTNQPLAGATIINKSTNKSAVSDANGNFYIQAADDDILVITNVGYTGKEIKAVAAGDIKLITDQKNLSEVVVTALGVKKRNKENRICHSGSER